MIKTNKMIDNKEESPRKRYEDLMKNDALVEMEGDLNRFNFRYHFDFSEEEIVGALFLIILAFALICEFVFKKRLYYISEGAELLYSTDRYYLRSYHKSFAKIISKTIILIIVFSVVVLFLRYCN